MPQGVYWLLTIPADDFVPTEPLDSRVAWIKGQRERGESGYEHWQIVVGFRRGVRLNAVKEVFGRTAHCELTRSAAAEDYVWKEDTRIAGTQFELGVRPVKRNSKKDWDAIRDAARCGKMDDIPSDVLVRYYGNIKRLAADHLAPDPMEREVACYWGRTGTGKSRRAWGEAGLDAYPKDPMSKFWDGYRGQRHVVMDEFRGGINIAHMLRWLDRYPCIVEVKGSSTVFKATKIWITSNLDPRRWYPEADQETVDALLRRMTITHYN